MAAFTTAEIKKVFSIIGLPQDGAGLIATSLSHRPPSLAQTWEPTWTTGNLSGFVAQVNTKLAAANDATCDEVRSVFGTWDAIKISPMRLTSTGSGEEGRVVDDEMQREAIRQFVGNELGISVPKGGFMADTARSYPANSSGGADLGDR